MLQLENTSARNIISETGKFYSYKQINKSVKTVQNAIAAINPKSIIIQCSDSFYILTSIIACLQSDVHFTVIKEDAPDYEKRTKRTVVKADLIIAQYLTCEFTLHYFINKDALFIGEDGEKILGREEFQQLEKKVKNKRFYPAYSIHDSIFYNFHRGICSEYYKYSAFRFNEIYNGIYKAFEELPYTQDTVVFLGDISSLHDIVNGILAPLKANKNIVFKNPKSIFDSNRSIFTKNSVLYTSSHTLEYILMVLNNENKKLFKMPFIGKMVLAHKLNKLCQTNIHSIIISGKINKFSLLNKLSIPKTTLYTMSEVASFVSFKKYYSNIKRGYSVGKPCDSVIAQIAGKGDNNEHGIIILYTNDMCVATNQSFQEDVFFHDYPGRINTRDVGYYNSKGELIVVDKTKFIVENQNGKIINTGHITEYALGMPFVKNVMLVPTATSSMVLLVEPNTEYADKHKIDMYDLKDLVKSLESVINRKFNYGALPIVAKLFVDSDGLDVQTYKLVVRSNTL
jgi:hypothetical protein